MADSKFSIPIMLV